MLSDRELLELAAKAYGPEIVFEREYLTFFDKSREGRPIWNPLTNDGDALRLAVKLEMALDLTIAMQENADVGANDQNVDCNSDPYAATRRAIVRAAAEIGRQM